MANITHLLRRKLPNRTLSYRTPSAAYLLVAEAFKQISYYGMHRAA